MHVCCTETISGKNPFLTVDHKSLSERVKTSKSEEVIEKEVIVYGSIDKGKAWK